MISTGLRQLLSSGTTVDGRQLDDHFIRQVYENTHRLSQDRHHKILIRVGHQDTQEEGRGHASSLTIGPSNTQTGEGLALWGELNLHPQTAENLRRGMFTGISVGIAPVGYLRDGTQVGPHLHHVALLGTSPAAMPELVPDGRRGNLAWGTGEMSVQIVPPTEPKRNWWQRLWQPDDEPAPMLLSDPRGTSPWNPSSWDSLGGIVDARSQELERLREENRALRDELNKAQSKQCGETFDQLHRDGKVTAEDRPIFELIWKTAGYGPEAAIRHFNRKPTTQPVTMDFAAMKTVGETMTNGTSRKEQFLAEYARHGISKSEAESRWADLVRSQVFMESTD